MYLSLRPASSSLLGPQWDLAHVECFKMLQVQVVFMVLSGALIVGQTTEAKFKCYTSQTEVSHVAKHGQNCCFCFGSPSLVLVAPFYMEHAPLRPLRRVPSLPIPSLVSESNPRCLTTYLTQKTQMIRISDQNGVELHTAPNNIWYPARTIILLAETCTALSTVILQQLLHTSTLKHNSAWLHLGQGSCRKSNATHAQHMALEMAQCNKCLTSKNMPWCPSAWRYTPQVSQVSWNILKWPTYIVSIHWIPLIHLCKNMGGWNY